MTRTRCFTSKPLATKSAASASSSSGAAGGLRDAGRRPGRRSRAPVKCPHMRLTKARANQGCPATSPSARAPRARRRRRSQDRPVERLRRALCRSAARSPIFAKRGAGRSRSRTSTRFTCAHRLAACRAARGACARTPRRSSGSRVCFHFSVLWSWHCAHWICTPRSVREARARHVLRASRWYSSVQFTAPLMPGGGRRVPSVASASLLRAALAVHARWR